MAQGTILVIYHSQGGSTRALAQAAAGGAGQVEGMRVMLLPAAQAGLEELVACAGLVVATPEYFGYMAGAVKDFFDRTYEAGRERKEVFKTPYLTLVSAGNDGTGAALAVERICLGYPLRKVQEPLIVKGAVGPEHLNQARERGMLLAAGCEAGIF